MRNDYTKLITDVLLQPCPACGGTAHLWEYVEGPDYTPTKVVKCAHTESIGTLQNGIVNEGCLLYMPPDQFYQPTDRAAVRYWNEYSMALRLLRATRSTTPPAFTREQAIECLWAQLTAEAPTPLTPHWRKVLDTTYGWAVDALIECSRKT